jgi:hypothetical protein
MKQVACRECHLLFDTLLSKASYNSALSASTRGANVLETREGALIFIDVLVTFFYEFAGMSSDKLPPQGHG